MSEIQILNYKFREVCKIIPQLDMNGAPIEYMPQSQFDNPKNLQLHEYAKGPFCKFEIPSFLHQMGVYAIMVDDQVIYVDECEDLASRWNVGYGNISPRNCFTGGQPTNCRINNLILSKFKEGSQVKLYFPPLESRFDIENRLIEKQPTLELSKRKNAQYTKVRNK